LPFPAFPDVVEGLAASASRDPAISHEWMFVKAPLRNAHAVYAYMDTRHKAYALKSVHLLIQTDAALQQI
jgi:hypothetical protein